MAFLSNLFGGGYKSKHGTKTVQRQATGRGRTRSKYGNHTRPHTGTRNQLNQRGGWPLSVTPTSHQRRRGGWF
jgi:hypothetical protein